MKLIFTLLVINLVLVMPMVASEKSKDQILKEDSEAFLEKSQKIAAQFYSLAENEELKEITSDILNSDITDKDLKQTILSEGRRFFLFKYPSDGYQVKGYISFVSDSTENPLLILLRGGNRIFGLMNPATDLSCNTNYTVIATAYRGGVSEGEDEFGGAEVVDVHNLMQYFPTLQEKLALSFSPSKVFMLGASRGGMQMFLALARTPALQLQVDKVVSLSGVMDMPAWIAERNDVREIFINEFGLIPSVNEEEWVSLRNPLEVVPEIRKDLPVLILQGSADNRVSLSQGYSIVKKLEENGNPVTYIEVPGGEHCLRNRTDSMELISNWLEEGASFI